MAKTILNRIAPFDAKKEKIISFSWAGNQAYANRLIIYDANSLAVVYDKKIDAMTYTHALPSNILTNGKKYIAQCQVFDVEDIPSDLSDKLFFATYEAPEFNFYNIKNEQTIKSASYEAIIYYFQKEYEEIQSYKFYLYDGTKTLLSESNTLYDGNSIKYTYKALDNHTKYYVRCQGTTVNGMEIDTGYIQIYTDYKAPSTYGLIYAENDAQHGYIKLHTNVTVIECSDNKTFKFEDGMIDLRNDAIHYEEGFVIPDNFTLILRGMGLNQTATILELSNTQYSIKVSSYLYDDGQTRFKLTVPNPIENYILYSKPESFDENAMVGIWLRRIKDIYQLEVFVEEEYSLDNNLWYGRQMPYSPELYDMWIDTDDMFTYVVDKDIMKTYTSDEEPNDANLEIDDLWM